MLPLRSCVPSLPFLIIASALACQGDNLVEPTIGTLEITTSTTGAEPDADGYTVQMDAQPAQGIGAAATVQATEVTAGNHTVQLAGIAGNCTVVGDNPRSITITAGETTTVTFEVTCSATTGRLHISSSTSGPASDPNGYLVTLDGLDVGSLSATGELSLDRVAPGPHTLTLADVAPHCWVQDGNHRQVAVNALLQIRVSFVVRCLIAPAYRRIDLGTLGGRDSRAYAISQAGVIVGEAEAVRPPPSHVPLWYAFLWKDGAMRGLEGPPTFDNSLNGARAINSKGQVVGFVHTDGGGTNAFLWDGDLKINLGALGCRDEHAWAYGINDVGLVVGATWKCIDAEPGPVHGFIWDGKQMISLTPGEYFSSAHALNSAGQIVGSRGTLDGSQHAFLWGSTSGTDLGTLGGRFSFAHAINNAGQIAGSSTTPGTEYGGGPDHAFLWENGVMTDLGTLGGDYSVAYGINAARQVVGTSNRMPGGPPRAFLWENGVMKDLGTEAGDSSGAHGISDAGQVVGWSATSGGAVHATLWTPQ